MPSKIEVLAKYAGLNPSDVVKIDSCEYAVSTVDGKEVWGIYTPNEVVDEVFVPYLENSVDIVQLPRHETGGLSTDFVVLD